MNVSAKIKVVEVRGVILGVHNRPEEAPREDKKTASKKMKQEEGRKRATRTTKMNNMRSQHSLSPFDPATRVLQGKGKGRSLVGRGPQEAATHQRISINR